MKELQEILQKISQFAPDEKAILATVVDVKGSSYRLAGARMLIDANGNSIGTVSGGCLEADVLERAKKVLQTGEPTIITYDTTKNEDSVFGFGMGCRGVVQILLESVSRESEYFENISKYYQSKKPCVMVTVINSTNPNIKIGAHLFFNESHINSNEFVEEVRIDVSMALSEQKSFTKLISFGEIFIENIKPPVSLLLFGAGYDAIPLVDFAKVLGWKVSIIDHRLAWANAERFPNVEEIIVSRAENLDENLFKNENSVAVIMTHNYENDAKLLPRLMNSKCLYIGALGPKKRTEKILQESGQSFSEQQLSRLYAPIGLDIGAETPEEIALAIISEIKTALAKRDGGFLRERNGGIH
jgi:xanthine dehydrogenase accessory factor